MAVQHARDVFAGSVDRAVDDEAGGVHRVITRLELRALAIDLDETARRNLLEQHPVGIDEECVIGAWHSHGDVREDEVIPAIQGHEPVAGGKVDS